MTDAPGNYEAQAAVGSMTIPEQAEKLVDDLIQAAIDNERETVARKYTREALRDEREKVIAALVGVQRPEDVARASTISPSDPRVTIAGIRQFGLASDGSDLRDLEAAFTRLALPHTGQPQEGLSDCWAPWRALADAPVVPTKAHLKSTKLFLGSRYGSVGDAREIFQGDRFANQCVAVAINGDVAERLVRGANGAAPASPRAEGEKCHLSDYSDAEIATEHHHRAMRALGDQTKCVSLPFVADQRPEVK